LALYNQPFREKELRVITDDVEMLIQDVRPGRDIFLSVRDLSKISKGIAEVIWRFKFFAAELSITDQNQGGRKIAVGYFGKRLNVEKRQARV